MKQKGYTLIELVVVISIIGILIAFSIPALGQFNAPQEFRAASLLVKSDLRSLHNKAVNGVTARRSIDAILPLDGVPDTQVDGRVYWVARFLNNQSYYETGACQKTVERAERWRTGECSDMERKQLSSKVSLNVCASGCNGYAVYFSPVYGTISVYDAVSLETQYPTPPIVAGRTLSPITVAGSPLSTVKVTLTTTSYTNRNIVLTINSDGSLTEACNQGATTISCQ